MRNRDKNLKSYRRQFDLLKVNEQKEVNSNDPRFEWDFCTETNEIIQITEQKCKFKFQLKSNKIIQQADN